MTLPDLLERELAGHSELDDVLTSTLAILDRLGQPRIGLVSGPITADGPANVSRNIHTLLRHARYLEEANGIPIVAAPYVFTESVYERIRVHEIAEPRFHDFWRAVLRSGRVTDVYMVDGWDRSNGAMDEFRVASELGLAIHYSCRDGSACPVCRDTGVGLSA